MGGTLELLDRPSANGAAPGACFALRLPAIPAEQYVAIA
jgi:hypothetical protein